MAETKEESLSFQLDELDDHELQQLLYRCQETLLGRQEHKMPSHHTSPSETPTPPFSLPSEPATRNSSNNSRHRFHPLSGVSEKIASGLARFLPPTPDHPSENRLVHYFRTHNVELNRLITTIRASILTSRSVQGDELLNRAEEANRDNASWKSLTEPAGGATSHDLKALFTFLLEKRILREKRKTSLRTSIGSPEEPFCFVADPHVSYSLATDAASEEIRQLKSRWDVKRVSQACAEEGLSAHFPVILIPGYGASAMAVWRSEEQHQWEEERIWIGLRKLGGLAPLKRMESFIKGIGRDNNGMDEESARAWIRHIALDDDCSSDPPGIQVRPLEGLPAVDYLSHSGLAKKPSYVFGPIIRALKDVGYHPGNLKAAPYDWRLPISSLEERDHYFTQLKSLISNTVEFNHQRVVVVAHSMGNRVFQVFLHWVRRTDPGWIDDNIHAQLALGAPFLGATKSVRGLFSGDALGLEVFLQPHEALQWNKRTGALCSLLPLCHSLFPQPLCHFDIPSLQNLHHTIIRDENGSSVLDEFDNIRSQLASCARGARDTAVRPVWWQQLNWNLPEEENESPLYPENLQSSWIYDSSRSQKISHFQHHVHDHGVRTKFIEANQSDLIFRFKLRRGCLHVKVLLHGITLNKFSVGFDQVFCETQLCSKDQYSWFEDGGNKLMTKIPLKRSNLLLCVRLLNMNVLTVRVFVCPEEFKQGMTVSMADMFWNRKEDRLMRRPSLKSHLEGASFVGDYVVPDIFRSISEQAPAMWNVFKEMYVYNPLYLNQSEGQKPVVPPGIQSDWKEEMMEDIPVLQPPPVENLWCVYGTGLDTEVSYYYKITSNGEFLLDQSADKMSLQPSDANPLGLKIKEGIAYETHHTPQPGVQLVPNSGDGTVPYASLAFPHIWKKQMEEQKESSVTEGSNFAARLKQKASKASKSETTPTLPRRQHVNVQIVEVSDSEHREMLADELVHYHILQYVCTGTNPHAL